MVHLTVSFPGGRYHATRWGSHVNEGDIDWPPSPWRLLRALLAAGHTRLGWSEGPPEVAVALFEALASVRPVFHLAPEASASHTRHYMPQFGRATSKVLDPFLHLDRTRPALAVSWAVALDDDVSAMLDALLVEVSYLGRAESWAEIERVPEVPKGLLTCGERASNDTDEPLRLLCPVPAEDYRRWRGVQVEDATRNELQRRVQLAEAKGRKPPVRLSAKELASVEERFPAGLIGALSLDTNALRGAGWNRPPGTEEVVYWRPVEAVVTAPIGRPTERGVPGPRPTMALYAVSSETVGRTTLPPLSTAIRRGDAMHKALVAHGTALPDRGAVFSGRATDGGRSEHQHDHAHYLSLPSVTARRDALPNAGIAHVLVWAPRGFHPAEAEVLLALRRLWAAKIPALSLACIGIGRPSDFERLVPHARSSTTWVSQTPFVCPRYLKPRGRSSLAGQIRAELEQRGLPVPSSIEVETDAGWMQVEDPAETSRLAPWWRHFEIERPSPKGTAPTHHRPPQARTFGVRLSFPAPLAGPLALGFGAHFGLGLFVPEGGP